MKKLLVRADDLGYSEGINYGVAKSVKEGIIGSVGVMTNMHAVDSANFFKGLEIVAERYGLKYSGFPIDETPIKIANKDVYVSMDSMMPNYDPFESLKKVVENADEDKYYMFICHPGYLDGYILKYSSLTILRPMEVNMVCNPNTRKWLEESGVELITYNDL